LLGAQWDATIKKWFAPKGEDELVSRWKDENLIVRLTKVIGEERSFMNELQVDIIPKSCVFYSPRTLLSKFD